MNGDSSEAATAEGFGSMGSDAEARGTAAREDGDRSGDAVDSESRLIGLIRERPWACVLAAAGFGFLMARWLRGRE